MPAGRRENRRRRAELTAELDAPYVLLYGLDREDAQYILSTFQGAGDTQKGLFDGLTEAQRVLKQYDALRERSLGAL